MMEDGTIELGCTSYICSTALRQGQWVWEAVGTKNMLVCVSGEVSGGHQGFTSGILIGGMDKDCNREMSVCTDRLALVISMIVGRTQGDLLQMSSCTI